MFTQSSTFSGKPSPPSKEISMPLHPTAVSPAPRSSAGRTRRAHRPDRRGPGGRAGRARRHHGDLHPGRRLERHLGRRPPDARPGHRQGRLGLVRLRREQDRGEFLRHPLPVDQLLQVDRPVPLGLPGGGADRADQRRPGPEPRRGTPQGPLQLLDQHVRDVPAHRQLLLQRGEGRCGHQQHAVRRVHVPGQLPAARPPEPGHRPLPGHRRLGLSALGGPGRRAARSTASPATTSPW